MTQTDIRTLLKSTLHDRMKKNARYSIRALARDLDVTPAYISKVLSGKNGVSPEMAREISAKLGLTAKEQEIIVTQTESKYGRSKKLKHQAQARLERMGLDLEPLDVDAFKMISDWYALTLHTLIAIHTDTKDIRFFADRLGIQSSLVQEAIERLVKLEMIEETAQGYQRTGVYYANPAGIPSQSIRSYHSQMCDKAKEALEFQTVDERDFSNFVLPVDEIDLKAAKIMIKQFREAFNERFAKGPQTKTEVYALNVQFFRLSQKIKNKLGKI